MALATVEDLLLRKDCRTVGVLAATGDQAVPEAELYTNPIVLQALEDATGEVVSAMNFVGRYSEADLGALTGASAAKLPRIVCEVAFYLLYEFRPDTRRTRQNEYAAAVEAATAQLERLRKGELVFSIPAAIEAELPSVVDFPSVMRSRACGVVSILARNYFAQPQCGGCCGGQ